MHDTTSARATLRLSLVVLAFTGLAGAWEVLAAQAPGSPLHLGVLPGPIQLLRESAFTVFVLLFFAGSLCARLPRPAPRLLVLALHAGTVLSLGASLYAATQGMPGMQMHDLRADALPVFVLKYAGFVLLGIGLADLARRAF